MHTLFAVLKAFGAIVCILGLLVGFGWAMEWRRRRRFDRAGFAAFVQSGAPLKHEGFISAFGKAPFTKEHTIVSTHSAGTILFGTQGVSVGDPALGSE